MLEFSIEKFSKKEKKIVAVYGTLKKGQGAFEMLKGQRFKGKGITKSIYISVDCNFPGIVKVKNIEDFVSLYNTYEDFWDSYVGQIAVEVYEINDFVFETLCEYENCPHLYKVREEDIFLVDGTSLSNVTIFEFNQQEKLHEEILIPVNEYGIIDWVEYKTGKPSFSTGELKVITSGKFKEKNKIKVIEKKSKQKKEEVLFTVFNWGLKNEAK